MLDVCPAIEQEFFKMAPDVVERRAKGLELYMTTLIRRFPDMLASSHLDRWKMLRGGEGVMMQIVLFSPPTR